MPELNARRLLPAILVVAVCVALLGYLVVFGGPVARTTSDDAAPTPEVTAPDRLTVVGPTGSPSASPSPTGQAPAPAPQPEMAGLMPAPGKARACSSVEQQGVTFTFDRSYLCGAFANGDAWVAAAGRGTVGISSISPGEARGRNGWMVNPGSST